MNDTVSEAVEQNNETTPATTSVKVIEASNPSPEDMAALLEHVKVNYDFNVATKVTDFNFKKTKDKDTGVEIVRETVRLPMPYPSMQGIVDILEKGGKGLELLIETVETTVNSAARDLLYEDTNYNATNFPFEKVSWEFIANIPKAQRRGGGIPKDTWEAFAQDYLEVMPGVTGKSIEAVSNASKILLNKLSNIKTNKDVLHFIVEQLAIYAEASENAAEFQECLEFLLNKADTFLNLSSQDLLSNL